MLMILFSISANIPSINPTHWTFKNAYSPLHIRYFGFTLKSGAQLVFKSLWWRPILWSAVMSLFSFFPPKSRLPAIKVKYLLLAWLGILIASWVIYMQYASYSELCRGHVCHMVIVSIFCQCSDSLCHYFISVMLVRMLPGGIMLSHSAYWNRIQYLHCQCTCTTNWMQTPSAKISNHLWQ